MTDQPFPKTAFPKTGRATLLVFDPPQCCSSGVCGPDVDLRLVQFAADLKWLAAQGVPVERYNLAQQPTAFIDEPVVMEAIQTSGTGVLPLLLMGGQIVSHSRYPGRDELARVCGLSGEGPEDEAPVIVLDLIGAAGDCCTGDDCC